MWFVGYMRDGGVGVGVLLEDLLPGGGGMIEVVTHQCNTNRVV